MDKEQAPPNREDLRDIGVLCLVLVCGFVLLATWLWQVLLNTETGGTWWKGSRLKQLRDRMKGHQAELKQGVETLFIWQGGPKEQEQPSEDVNHYRTRSEQTFIDAHDIFRDSSVNSEIVFPDPPASLQFQQEFTTSKRWDFYKQLGHGALVRCWRFVCICGVLSIACMWMIRNCYAINHSIGQGNLLTDFFECEAVYDNFRATKECQSVLLPLASFLLALYINMKLGWFNGVLGMAWAFQSKLANIALKTGSCLAHYDPSDPQYLNVIKMKYRIYRYLNVVHFLLYSRLVQKYHKIGDQALKDTGLLEPNELALFQKIPSTKAGQAQRRNLVLIWLGNEFRKLAKEGKVAQDILPYFLTYVVELREGDALLKEVNRHYPISFAQLMQLMVDLLMLMTPAALAYLLRSDRDGWGVYIWPFLGSMCLSLFYQGGMKLICSMEKPFGSDLDNVRSDWLLMSSESAIFGFLVSVCPDLPPDTASKVTPAPRCLEFFGKGEPGQNRHFEQSLVQVIPGEPLQAGSP
jgi:hypothetical protein